MYLFMAALSLRCCIRAFSSCGVRSSHCGGFCCCRAWALEHAGFSTCSTWAQQLWCTGLDTPGHVGFSQTRNQTSVPCIARQILNHWTIKEVPKFSFFFKQKQWKVNKENVDIVEHVKKGIKTSVVSSPKDNILVIYFRRIKKDSVIFSIFCFHKLFFL